MMNNKLDSLASTIIVRCNYSNILALSSARFFGGMLINNLKGHDKHQTHGLLSDLGWEVYPEGLYDTIMQIKTRWNKPVMVTENGIAEKLDKYRAPYIVAHIEQVKRAIDNGAKVLGYIYWSLMITMSGKKVTGQKEDLDFIM
jgi:beta-glucosidase/6-phospho-beta-glucosidase/beta-galactosidase